MHTHSQVRATTNQPTPAMTDHSRQATRTTNTTWYVDTGTPRQHGAIPPARTPQAAGQLDCGPPPLQAAAVWHPCSQPRQPHNSVGGGDRSIRNTATNDHTTEHHTTQHQTTPHHTHHTTPHHTTPHHTTPHHTTPHHTIQYVTGHSLGAAVATLLSRAIVSMRDKYWPENKDVSVVCYNFGSPRCGNKTFAKDYNENVPYTYRHVNDQVCCNGLYVMWSNAHVCTRVSYECVTACLPQ